jgi:hypothetical protein
MLHSFVLFKENKVRRTIMKFTRIVVVTLVLMLLAASYSVAELRKPGINGASFLKIGAGARMVALGSAATTIHSDPNCIFWNPGAIAIESGKTQVSFNYNNWIAGINHMTGAITRSFGDIGTFGFGAIYMGLTDLQADRDIAPPGIGAEFQYERGDVSRFDPFDYSDLALILAYSKQFTSTFRMGMSIKYIREDIDTQAADAVAFDFGAVYETGFRDVTLGARLTNVGGDLTFYAVGAPLPLNFAIGLSGSLAKEENMSLKAYLDFTKPQDSPQLFFSGLEWEVLDLFALRGGYKFGYSGALDDETNNNQTDEGLSMGGGLNLPFGNSKVWLDYSYTSFNIFNDTHRFSFKFEF